uniref:GPI transamidase component PIG-S n=1 Tax=Lygus hesperus TaxID=30085 RepID=A0A0A9XXF0_LYGHE
MESDRAVGEAASSFNDSAEEAEKIDKYRMGAAISFAVMLLVIGIPLWWKTTEVHRAALPYSQIEAMDPSSVTIRMKIWVSASSPTRTSNIIMLLKSSLVDHQVLKVDALPLKMGLDDVTFEVFEKHNSRWLPETLGNLILVEVPSLNGSDILFTNDRIVYFSPNADVNVLARLVKEHLLHDYNLVSKVVSIVSPQNLSVKDDTFLNALRASPSYDVVLTVINSDPEHLAVNWDVASDLRRYFQPLLNQVDDISSHHVKSQWLYLLDLGETPKMDSAGVNVLSFSQLPHIITPLRLLTY